MDQLPKVDIKLDVNELADKTLIPATSPLFKTMGNLFNVLYYKTLLWPEQARIVTEYNIKKFENNLRSKLESIPEDDRQEPKLSIAGPTMEATKYYIGEECMSDMFTNLLVASANKKLNDQIRGSFVEIIKQLEPIDAEILDFIYKNGRSVPAVIYQMDTYNEQNHIQGFRHLSGFVIELHSDIDLVYIASAAIDNLIRLGLIESPDNHEVAGEDIYKWVTQTTAFNSFVDYSKTFSLKNEKNTKISFEKRKLQFTSLGKDFFKVCILLDHKS